MKNILLVFIVFTVAISSACNNAPNKSKTAGFNKQSTLLMTLPTGYESGEVIFSDNGFQVAAVLQKDGKMWMSINSALSREYEFVRSPVFQTGTKQYAFIARKDGKECVVFNGKEGAFHESVRNPMITAEGRLVYVAKRGDKWVIVSDNKESEPFESTDPSLFASPDGKRLAFLEKNSRTKKFNLCVYSSNLKEYAKGREYDEIYGVSSSASATHLAYPVVKNSRQTLVQFDFRQPGCTEKEGSWHEKVGNYSLSQNGEYFAYFAQRQGKHYLVSGANEWPCKDYKMLSGIYVSDKGNVLYTGAIEYSIILSLDGKVITDRRESIDNLSFSSDSKHYLFVTGPCPLIPVEKPVEFAYLVIDGHESKKYDKIANARFSPDNMQILFRARQAGKRFVVLADRSGKIVEEQPPFEAVWDFKFSPDGKYVGYGARTGQELWWQVATLAEEKQVK